MVLFELDPEDRLGFGPARGKAYINEKGRNEHRTSTVDQEHGPH